jgi:hypothetical protein
MRRLDRQGCCIRSDGQDSPKPMSLSAYGFCHGECAETGRSTAATNRLIVGGMGVILTSESRRILRANGDTLASFPTG